MACIKVKGELKYETRMAEIKMNDIWQNTCYKKNDPCPYILQEIMESLKNFIGPNLYNFYEKLKIDHFSESAKAHREYSEFIKVS